MSIMNAPVGFNGVVSRVRTHDVEKLQYFAAQKLTPGQPFEIVGRAPFNGPMRLRLDHEEVVLGAELAQSLWISQA